MAQVHSWTNPEGLEPDPVVSRDLGLEFSFAEVKPSAFRWMRKIWMDQEWAHHRNGYNRRVFEDEYGRAAKRLQHKVITLGCYLKESDAEMLGWAIGEYDGTIPTIYFAYTKPYYRKCGVFKALLDEFGYQQDTGFVTSSWLFAAGNHGGRKRKLNAHFNPYKLFRRAYEY